MHIMRSETVNSLASYVEALRPIIFFNHFDLHEVEGIIHEVDPQAKFLEFDPSVGSINFETKAPEGECELLQFLDMNLDAGQSQSLGAAGHSTAFIILRNIQDQLKDPKVVSCLMRFAEKVLYDDDYSATIFIVSPIKVIPPELENFITIFEQSLPSSKEIHSIIENFVKDQDSEISEDDCNELVLALKGLNEFQIQQILSLAYQTQGYITSKDKELIVREKQQLIKKNGLLELVQNSGSIDDIGGLNQLKQWLQVKAKIFADLDHALRFGVDVPKGVLILGMPGCGKSLIAKATASLFTLPLMRLDIGRLLGKYVGESEQNLRNALALAEAISPCVLWVDEVEKAFSGIGSSNGMSSDVTVRLFGQFLTWMQEKESPVFIVATANDVSNLPPEFLRKGRFDELFFVDLPNQLERQSILELHLKRRRNWNHSLDLKKVAESCDKFSGADLESVVKDAIERAFVQDKKQLATDDLVQAAKKIRPIALALKDKISKISELQRSMNIRNAR